MLPFLSFFSIFIFHIKMSGSKMQTAAIGGHKGGSQRLEGVVSRAVGIRLVSGMKGGALLGLALALLIFLILPSEGR